MAEKLDTLSRQGPGVEVELNNQHTLSFVTRRISATLFCNLLRMIGMSRVFGLQCQCNLTNSVLVFGSYHTIFSSENSMGFVYTQSIIPIVGGCTLPIMFIVYFFQFKKNVLCSYLSSLPCLLELRSVKAPFPASGLRNIHKSRLQQSPNLVFVRPLTDAMIIPSPLHQLSFSLLVRPGEL